MKKIRKALTSFFRNYSVYKTLEKYLYHNFKKGDDFYIFQIGAHDGISHDFLYDFLFDKKVYGIAVEPIQDYFEKLKTNFQKFDQLIVLNLAVHNDLRNISIYKIGKQFETKVPDWAIGSASFFKEHLITKCQIPEEYIEEEIVKASSVTNILNEHYSFNRLDLLQIDTEGYDYEVLKQFNFNHIIPKIIKLEYSNLHQEEILEAKTLLSNKGYLVLLEGNDIVAYKMSRFANLFIKIYKHL